ncbi:RTA1-domain-containing protein [Amniculicola lignicola CBS 123094]|uniref:RTA1-domain-containing protein n=1 Tax=Amniculicola lignicola CBS 123094 TaxID=1392246 RepID=A0A6A5WF73_9PLEO|nr:RTA1-domain-containing protein [Amniculicola lignicola CBS 123094]
MGLPENYHPSLDDPNAWVPYRYIPSKAAAIVFVIVFSITTFLHIFQLIKKRTWYFIPLVIGGFFEIIGYIGRIISIQDIWKLGPYIIQSLLLLVAPALFAASVYIILGRIILMVDGERYSLIRQKWLTKIFVTGDVLSFMVQGGATISSMHTGERLIIVGLVLQLVFFGLFIVVAGLFHYRLVNDTPSKSLSLPFRHSRRLTVSSTAPINGTRRVNIHELPWKSHLYVLYSASILILIRSLFRLIEYAQGNGGYLLKHEYFLYVFDAMLMFFTMVIFNWIHPSEITDCYKKRMTEEEGLGMHATRDAYLGTDNHESIRMDSSTKGAV